MRVLILLFLSSLTISEGPFLGSCVENSILASKIARQEGFYVENSLPARQNNPGALVFAHQPHASLGKRGFAKFDCAFHGWEALHRLISAKVRRKTPLFTAWTYLAPADPEEAFDK